MSKYGQFETCIRDERYLVAALKEMGYAPEVHQAPGAPLYGYRGDERPERAHVIIRRAQVGASSNDIGFVRGPDGTYRAIVSEFDQRNRYGQAWLNKVTQGYAEQRTLAIARQKGYVFQGRQVTQDGKVRLLFGVR